MCERQVLAIILLLGLSGVVLGQVSGVGTVSGTSLTPPP